jgi:hypothetical protein
MLLTGSLSVVVLVFAVIWIVNNWRRGATDARPPSQAFDPATTDREELRRVTEAVSRIITAPPSEHAAAVETLESVRADSPGARDLKEACVNTYRGLMRAEEATAQLRSIEELPDGAVRPAASIPQGDRVRATELNQQAREQIELVAQSRNRCMDLFTEATARMGIARPRPAGGN